MKYFSDKTVNPGRQPEIDISKAICIVLMILIHAYMASSGGYHGIITGLLGYGAGFLGAGTFMICMGIGMRYSQKQDASSNLYRGILLLTIGQVLNLLRAGIPGLIAYKATGNQNFIPYMLGVIDSDIITFAGLAFILMALLKTLKLGDGVIFLIGIILNFLMVPFYSIIGTPKDFWINKLINLFFLTDNALFPLCTHFVFVAFGYLVGGYYRRIIDKTILSKRVLFICIPIVVVYFALRFTVPFPFMPKYVPEDEPVLATDALAVCLDTLITFAAMYKLVTLQKIKVPTIVFHLSKHINAYYCISDIILYVWGILLIATRGSLLPASLVHFVIGIIVIAVCYLVIEINNKIIHFSPGKMNKTVQIIAFFVIWLASAALSFYAYHIYQLY
ncbi:acyltransferase family protein [Butyrivibrio sp. AD3002]|uniref:acyltransferase family protein n=1 Tax=Butyrivibrio sp. AD3002 TaxID=1280670 RepID=UPI0003B51EE7|nr:acyltransferase family protein [Butyrivibrio sp. AD3002]